MKKNIILKNMKMTLKLKHILVTCFNFNQVNKMLSVDEILSSYKLKNFIN